MKFKVGDKVRLTREAIARNAGVDFEEYEISGGEITNITNYGYHIIGESYSNWDADDLELVPEEPEFKRGEIVEVWVNAEGKRVKRIFLCEAIGAKFPYICVDANSQEDFMNGKPFLFAEWDKMRKVERKLTRKEIAEKFGVSEDFTLVE